MQRICDLNDFSGTTCWTDISVGFNSHFRGRLEFIPEHDPETLRHHLHLSVFCRAATNVMAHLGTLQKSHIEAKIAFTLVLQGSIQATLAAAPLELSYLYKSTDPQYLAWAETIASVGVYSILIGATIAWLAAGLLGPLCLAKVMLFSQIWTV